MKMKQPPKERPCKMCGTSYPPYRYEQLFCSPTCKKRWWRRAEVRGAAVYDLLVKWRRSRGKDKTATLGKICGVVDHWMYDDEDAGLARPPRSN